MVVESYCRAPTFKNCQRSTEIWTRENCSSALHGPHPWPKHCCSPCGHAGCHCVCAMRCSKSYWRVGLRGVVQTVAEAAVDHVVLAFLDKVPPNCLRPTRVSSTPPPTSLVTVGMQVRGVKEAERPSPRHTQ